MYPGFQVLSVVISRSSSCNASTQQARVTAIQIRSTQTLEVDWSLTFWLQPIATTFECIILFWPWDPAQCYRELGHASASTQAGSARVRHPWCVSHSDDSDVLVLAPLCWHTFFILEGGREAQVTAWGSRATVNFFRRVFLIFCAYLLTAKLCGS